MSAISLHILIYSCLIKQSKFRRGKLYQKSLCPHTSLHVNVRVVLFCCLLAFKIFIIFVYSLCVYVERSEDSLWEPALSILHAVPGAQTQAVGLRTSVFSTEPSCRSLVVCFLWERSHTVSQIGLESRQAFWLSLPSARIAGIHELPHKSQLTSFPWLKQQATDSLFEGSQTNVYFLFYLCWGVFCDLMYEHDHPQ